MLSLSSQYTHSLIHSFTSTLPRPAKSVLKLALALPGGALTNFPCNYASIFFSSLDVQVHPLHPLAMRLWEQEAPLPRRAQRVRRA